MIKTLGQRIRELREEKEVSLREFAAKLSVSAPFLSDIELGKRNPSQKVLENIAKLLHTTIEELKKYDTRPPMEKLRQLANQDPRFGLAFRRMIDNKNEIDPEELLRLVDKKEGESKKKP